VKKIFRLAASAAVQILLLTPLSADITRDVDFFGIASPDAEKSMVSMTETLYLTQLGEISGITVIDRRSSGFTSSFLETGSPDFTLSDTPLSFFAVIRKNASDDGSWTCTLTVYNSSSDKSYTYSKKYDSYYKILMESKSSLQQVFKDLLNQREPVPQTDSSGNDDTSGESSADTSGISTESIAGTWTGEDNIEKIVILRGGRGFIIYKNGAAMNISVAVVSRNGSQSVIVSQSGKPNASFYPELPRKTALEAATTADPITWSLMFENGKTLSGSKKTLVMSGDSAVPGTVSVKWVKK
jgi:hypothetical protein